LVTFVINKQSGHKQVISERNSHDPTLVLEVLGVGLHHGEASEVGTIGLSKRPEERNLTNMLHSHQFQSNGSGSPMPSAAGFVCPASTCSRVPSMAHAPIAAPAQCYGGPRTTLINNRCTISISVHLLCSKYAGSPVVFTISWSRHGYLESEIYRPGRAITALLQEQIISSITRLVPREGRRGQDRGALFFVRGNPSEGESKSARRPTVDSWSCGTELSHGKPPFTAVTV
jgi:hypothetical protein